MKPLRITKIIDRILQKKKVKSKYLKNNVVSMAREAYKYYIFSSSNY